MDLQKLQHDIGVEFCDEGLLVQALTHSSCLNEPQRGYLKSNESLAWLGDALINWVVSEHIFNPDDTKEKLTDCRKIYVNKMFLAGLSKKHGLDKALILPEGQENEGGRVNQKNLHTVFEALVGAIYRDQGFDAVRGYVVKTCVQGELGSQ
ncbi:MAG TPA: ribonuclease III domain-containing protein [Candidatus Bathyarchaeia archaeon]